MRKWIVSFVFATITALPGAARADLELSDKVVLSGQFRPRLELDDRDFDHSTPVDPYATLRTRLGITVKEVVPRATFYLLMGDSRTMGYSDPYLEGQPIGPNQLDANLGVIMTYLLLDDLVRPGGYLQIGRMDNDQGGNRIFGPGNWNYSGPRTYDGIKAGYRADAYSVNLWSFYGLYGDRHWYPDPTQLPAWEIPDPNLDHTHDHLLTGFDLRLLSNKLQFLFFLDHDAHEVEVTATGDTNPANLRATAAVYGEWSCSEKWKEQGGTSLKGDLAYQFGELGTSRGTSTISAWLAKGDVAYSLGGARTPWAGLGFDLTSGDRNKSGGDTYYFYDYYYSRHNFRGHMDYFGSPTGVAANGLQDFIVRVGATPSTPVKVQLDAHYFRTLKPIVSEVDGADAHGLGVELDLTATYKVRGNLEGDVGIDLFFPTDDWQGAGADFATFVYTTLNAEF